MLTKRQIIKTFPPGTNRSYYLNRDFYGWDQVDKKTYNRLKGYISAKDRLIVDEAQRYLDIVNLVSEIVKIGANVYRGDKDADIVLKYKNGELRINFSQYPEIVANEIWNILSHTK